MMLHLNPQIIKKIDYIFLVVLIFVLCVLVRYQVEITFFPYQLEYREGVSVLMTDALLHGHNPFDIDHQPLYANSSGIFYNWLVFPFAQVFGCTFILHRLVSGFFLICSCVFLFYLLRRQTSLLLSLCAAVLYLAQLLYPGQTTPIAGPHSLGILLMLLSIFIPHLCAYNRRSIFVSVILGLMAFYTKPYFLLGSMLVCAYMILFVSRVKGLVYLSILFFGFLMCALLISQLYPTYFNFTIILTQQSMSFRNSHLWSQMYDFALLNGGIILSLITVMMVWIWNKKSMIRAVKERLEMPLDLFCLLCMLLIFCFLMGRNIGQNMGYPVQLISPFLILLTFRYIQRLEKFRFFFLLLCLLPLFLYIKQKLLTIKSDVSILQWQKLDHLMATHHNIFNSPALVSILYEQHKFIYDTGHTEYFPYSFLGDHNGRFLVPSQVLRAQYFNYLSNIRTQIQHQQFDLIIHTVGWNTLLPKEITRYYNFVEQIEVQMPHSKQIWKLAIWKTK